MQSLFQRRALSLYRKTSANKPPFPTSPPPSILYDFRSDTVTIPCAEMRKRISEAIVGDDVYGEDPTVLELERKMAKISGKEAALFVVSGTLSNQIGIMTHLKSPPHSILLDSNSHIYNYECAGVAFHSGAGTIPLSPTSGYNHLTADVIENSVIMEDDVHYAPTRIVALENTLNGQIFPIEEITKISRLANHYDMAMHLDGARLWNASAATGISIQDYCKHFNTISLCLSKSLGAPIGSVLVGDYANIKKAKHLRKLFGGGWRQAGILAAAGLFAIENNFPRLAESHSLAQYLAQQLADRCRIEPVKPVDTNMVWVDFKAAGIKPADLDKACRHNGVMISSSSGRLVTHLGVDASGVDLLVKSVQQVLQEQQ